MDTGPLQSLGTATFGAAGTLTTDPITGLSGLAGLSGWLRFAGTGGTSCDIYLQESPDQGATWLDLMNAHFTATGVSLFGLEQGAANDLPITDGALASNTSLNSGIAPLFDQYRLKIVTVGVWTNGIVAAYGMPRG